MESTLEPGRRRNLAGRVLLLVVVCVLGLCSRRFRDNLPGFVAAYAGDTLWAFAVFLGIGLLMAKASTLVVAFVASGFAVLIEFGQLYHAPWIDSIRRTTVGGLVLGFDFVWSDLACYALGVGMGVVMELASTNRKAVSPK